MKNLINKTQILALATIATLCLCCSNKEKTTYSDSFDSTSRMKFPHGKMVLATSKGDKPDPLNKSDAFVEIFEHENSTSIAIMITPQHSTAISLEINCDIYYEDQYTVLFDTIDGFNQTGSGMLTVRPNDIVLAVQLNHLQEAFDSRVNNFYGVYVGSQNSLGNDTLHPIQSPSHSEQNNENWKTIAHGITKIYNPQTTENEELTFDNQFDDQETFQGILTIKANNNASIKTFTHFLEVGGQFLEAMYPVTFGKQGNLICAQWSQGAPLVGMTFYGLDKNGQIIELFDDASRNGFHIDYNRLKNDIPKIIKIDSDDDALHHIYSYSPNSGFTLDESVQVSPH